jgi:hypothetical protein
MLIYMFSMSIYPSFAKSHKLCFIASGDIRMSDADFRSVFPKRNLCHVDKSAFEFVSFGDEAGGAEIVYNVRLGMWDGLARIARRQTLQPS